jgi:6-pyruvoyltetrahydropterin/6-carboxytetrahydropterin synthase
MYEIDITREFSAAHCLKGYKGNCSTLHGHNWTVTAVVKAEELDELGIAVDFRKLKSELDAFLMELDHKNLSTLKYFKKENPTSEKIAKLIFEKLSKKMNQKSITIDRVRVCESAGSGATYYK